APARAARPSRAGRPPRAPPPWWRPARRSASRQVSQRGPGRAAAPGRPPDREEEKTPGSPAGVSTPGLALAAGREHRSGQPADLNPVHEAPSVTAVTASG